jgi:hypothetical protein
MTHLKTIYKNGANWSSISNSTDGRRPQARKYRQRLKDHHRNELITAAAQL